MLQNNRLTPWSMCKSIWGNRNLILRLVNREIESRYRGSLLGMGWAVIIPVLLLGIYTFVFSEIFQARWDTTIGGHGTFALVLFTGIVLFNLFSESVARAPTTMLSNVTYIKKVVFPLEILPLVVVLSAVVTALISVTVLILGYLVLIGIPPATALLLPLTALPVLFLALGVSWFFASLGVYFRDLQQIISVILMILMFLSPIFYPISAVPEKFREVFELNPLAVAIEQARGVLFSGELIAWNHWLVFLVFSMLIAWLGYVWFMTTRRGFADVV